MKNWLEINRRGGHIEKRPIKPQGQTGLVEGSCPGCGVAEFRVQGGNPTRLPDNETIRSEGRCVDCNDPVGYLFAKVSTIFGREEDERVLYGRARVY